MTKLTETQTIILITGVQRPENIAMPLPKGLAGAAAKMAVTKMIEHSWLQEVDANLRRNEPLWRETGDGHGTTLVVTNAGLLAIGIEPVVVKTMTAIHKHAAEPPSPKPPTPRPGTKQAMLIFCGYRPWCKKFLTLFACDRVRSSVRPLDAAFAEAAGRDGDQRIGSKSGFRTLSSLRSPGFPNSDLFDHFAHSGRRLLTPPRHHC